MARTYKDISYTAMERKADGDMRTLAHSRRVRHMANGGALAGRIDALEHGTRCHGDCPYCSDDRLHATRRAMEAADAKLGEAPGRIGSGGQALVAQWIGRPPPERKAAGSNPAQGTRYAFLAQGTERGSPKAWVVGSNPTEGTRSRPHRRMAWSRGATTEGASPSMGRKAAGSNPADSATGWPMTVHGLGAAPFAPMPFGLSWQ